jgi:hypothetical protein
MAIASAAAAGAVAIAVVLVASPPPSPARTSGPVAAPARTVPQPVRADCSGRSEADFPRAFADPRNLVVGPLALVGGGEATPAAVIRRFGGQKFPLLVRAGHTVTVRIPASAHAAAGLVRTTAAGRGAPARHA